jgi:glutamate/tyrosine decarboxylase-like PLP-dependent enzyme
VPPPDHRLELSREQMRALGYRVIDILVEHCATLGAQRVGSKGSRAGLEALLRQPLPEQPSGPEEVLRRIERDVFAHMLHVDHPRFFAFVPSPGNFVGAMGEALAAGVNPFVGTWLAGSGPAELELVTVDWLRQICGLPETAGGLFVSGGSMANLTALAVARRVKLGDRIEDAVVYCSDQTHSAVDKGLGVLGYRPEQIRKLPSDEEFRLSPGRLEREILSDRATGKRPFCVIANAGTTNTGAVDPLVELRRLCDREGLWLHADGAYGAAAMLCEEGRRALAGLAGADSLALDPHKWLFQPFEIGCVLVREARWLRETFAVRPEYLQDAEPAEDEVNFADRGIQLSRSFRALKLWMTFQVFGAAALRQAVAWGIHLAEKAEALLRQDPRWRIVAPARLGIIAFRWAPPGLTDAEADALNTRLVERLFADGYAMVTSTVLQGRTVLRLCTINPRTAEQEVAETIHRLSAFSAGLRQETSATMKTNHGGPSDGPGA